MSLLIAEGFDDGLYENRTTASGGVAVVAGRTGNARELSNGFAANDRWTFPSADKHATFVVGFALKLDVLSAATQDILKLYGDDFGTHHITLAVGTSGDVNIYRGTVSGTLLGSTDTGVISQSVYHYVELYVTLSDTVGVVKVRVDGETPAGWSDLTSQDTKNGGTAVTFDTVQIQGATQEPDVDDLYIFNGVASAGDNPNNDVIGDSAVVTIFPDGNGATSQLDGSDGNQTNNFELVDETTASSTAFTGSTSTGNLDTYAYSNVSTAVDQIFGLIVSSWAAKSSAGNRGFATIVRTSGSQSTSTGYALQATYGPHDIIYETNPNQSTEEWTVTNVNAAEFGVVVTT